MEKIPARAGLQWVKEGFLLFRKQPIEFSTLFLSYMFFTFALGILPVLGQLLPLILIPVFSIAFLQASADAEQGKRVYPKLLLTGFRSPALAALLRLGILYLLAAIVAVAASMIVDGGVFWNVMTGQIVLDEKTMAESDMLPAMLFAAAVYIPAAMAFWHAAPLIAWQSMPVGKAVFFSFFAVYRAGKAFIVYGLAWLLISILLPAIVSSIVALIVGKAVVTVMLLLPVSILLTVVLYCSFYPTYAAIFGKPWKIKMET